MENKIEKEAMFKITYGLFVLSAKDGEKDNGCIVNTVSMITETPKRITVYVNKLNYTEQMIRKTGVFNVSVLTESAPFEVFKQFGFCSGRDHGQICGQGISEERERTLLCSRTYQRADFRESGGRAGLRNAYAVRGGGYGSESAFRRAVGNI